MGSLTKLLYLTMWNMSHHIHVVTFDAIIVVNSKKKSNLKEAVLYLSISNVCYFILFTFTLLNMFQVSCPYKLVRYFHLNHCLRPKKKVTLSIKQKVKSKR